jgi:hypothetical protein
MKHTTHTHAVLAQREVNGAPGEVPGFQLLLADLEVAGVVVTADPPTLRPRSSSGPPSTRTTC